MAGRKVFPHGRSLAPFLLAAGLAMQAMPSSAADPDVARPVQVIQSSKITPLKPRRSKQVYSLARVMRGEVPGRRRWFGKSGLDGRLTGLLGRIERKFGRPVTITSGCRSRVSNRRAGGARGSWHLRCMAADIRVAGVSEGRLLHFARQLPGAGGVGTYCGNSIVHIDVGPRRAWSGGCGRKKRRR